MLCLQSSGAGAHAPYGKRRVADDIGNDSLVGVRLANGADAVCFVPAHDGAICVGGTE